MVRPSRRLRVISLTPEWLFELLKAINGHVAIVSAGGLPEDAVFVACDYDTNSRIVHLYAESETFEVIDAGASVPRLTMTLTIDKALDDVDGADCVEA